MTEKPLNVPIATLGPGRPQKEPPFDVAERVEAMASEAASIVWMAKKFGVSKATFQRWMADREEIRDAIALARESERLTLHQIVYRKAVESEGKDSLLAAMYLLNSRHSYRTEQVDSHGGRVNVTINLPGAMPLDQYMKTVSANATNSDDDAHADNAPAPRAIAARRG